jgi:NADPH-dependent 2,4-dienoyl-CoA reductase/sulfur reductase-like enzyme
MDLPGVFTFRDLADVDLIKRHGGAGRKVVVIGGGLLGLEAAKALLDHGKRVTLGSREFTIVGVAPARFTGTELYFHPDLYVPLTMSRDVASTIPADFLDDRSDRRRETLGETELHGVDALRERVRVDAERRGGVEDPRAVEVQRDPRLVGHLADRAELVHRKHRATGVAHRVLRLDQVHDLDVVVAVGLEERSREIGRHLIDKCGER